MKISVAHLKPITKPAPLKKPFAVTSLELNEYKGFHQLQQRDWGGVNIIVGANGAGKSSILRAIAASLSRFVNPFTPGSSILRVLPSDITLGAKRLDIKTTLEYDEEDYEQQLTARGQGLFARIGTKAKDFKMLAGVFQSELEENDDLALPVICFYGVNRSVQEITLEHSGRPQYHQIDGYIGAFTAERRFPDFFEWFREREDLENERRARKEEFSDYQLEGVRQAISALMDGYRDLRVERAPLRMLVNKGKEALDVNVLSDGEKTLLAMAGDLGRRLAILNPSSREPLMGEGVVLIDEVDLHLHPSWQRRVVKRLPEVFPNIQFFMTTHSPIVASSAPPGSLYLLDNRQLKNKEIYGQDVALVLDEIFDTPARDERVQLRLDKLFEAITNADANEAISLLGELELSLGTNDPLLTRARTRMRGLGLA